MTNYDYLNKNEKRSGYPTIDKPWYVNYNKNELEKEIQRIIKRPKKVKPGYKKKRKREIQAIYQKKKRDIIRKDIQKQKKERAKQAQREKRERENMQ